MPNSTLRQGRVVHRRHWIVPEGGLPNDGNLGTAGSWADAVNRISVTGECLVVDVSDLDENPDRKARRRGLQAIRAAMRVVARRRAIGVSGHQQDGRIYFHVL